MKKEVKFIGTYRCGCRKVFTLSKEQISHPYGWEYVAEMAYNGLCPECDDLHDELKGVLDEGV